MMRKEDLDRYVAERPFKPFEIRMVDGQRFRIDRVEQLLVGRTTVATLRRGDIVHISIGLISTIGRPRTAPGRRRPRKS